MKNRLILTILVFCLTLGLYGCSVGTSGSKMNQYKDDMTSFFDSVSEIDTQMNSIDTESEGYKTELLTYLDRLDILFSEMAEFDVPSNFVGVKELSEDASKNMSQAVNLYHSAYGDDFYNDDQAKEAYIYYVKASHEIQYILRVLHGENYEDILNGIKEGNTEVVNFDNVNESEEYEEDFEEEYEKDFEE